MKLDNKLLKKYTILYVEDDDTIRVELSEILEKLFLKVYLAKNGQEGLELFERYKNIDIILVDINMPILNGIDMIRHIRKKDENIPVIFATAYSDSKFLLEAIRLRAQEYIIKPIDIKYLITLINKILKDLYQEFLLKQYTKELQDYKKLVDLYNIVIKTDINMDITYVNALFCEISGFSQKELIGKNLKEIKHSETSIELYKKISDIVLGNKTWSGRIKNIKKDSNSFTTDCNISALLDDSGKIIGMISIQRDITQELIKKRNIQKALIKEKSKVILKSKEGNAEQINIISSLKQENKTLKDEIDIYRKNDNPQSSYKLINLNSDLKTDLKKIKKNLQIQKENEDKNISQLKINYGIKIEELEQKIEELNEKIESTQSDEVLLQKLEYWKEKAKNESKRIEILEKRIIDYADENAMNRIFS